MLVLLQELREDQKYLRSKQDELAQKMTKTDQTIRRMNEQATQATDEDLLGLNLEDVVEKLQACLCFVLFLFCFVLFLFFFLICIMYFTVLIKFYFAIARLCLLQPDGVTFDNIRDIVRQTSAKDSLESRITKKARIIAGILDMDQGSTHFCGYMWRICEQNCLTQLRVHFDTRWDYRARRSSRGMISILRSYAFADIRHTLSVHHTS